MNRADCNGVAQIRLSTITIRATSFFFLDIRMVDEVTRDRTKLLERRMQRYHLMTW